LLAAVDQVTVVVEQVDTVLPLAPLVVVRLPKAN
jgi:hypothetical protein